MPAQSHGIITAVNSLNVLRRRTQGHRRETRAGQHPAKRPRRRSTIAVFARRSTGRWKPVTGTRMPAAAVTRRWIVRPIRQYTRAALDKRSSLDSLQQALFFSVLTGKRPAVVIYDTDGQEGQFEYRIRTACQKSGVRYEVFR